MTIDDPFASGDEGDRTIIRPVPGGRRPGSTAESPPPPSPRPAPSPDSTPISHGVGLNPLEAAAEPLLSLIMRLKNTSSHPDPEQLRQRMIEEIKTFTTNARNTGLHEKTVFRARYVLCTTLDEVVLNTPWGRASEWSENSLLITFHNETWGGEKVFELLDAIIQDPRKNLDLLELMYLCLAFGFQGRYRLLDNGRSRLDEQRERTYNAIRTARGEFERDLSPHWRGSVEQQNPLMRYVPLWVVAAVATALLLLAYTIFSWLLNSASDPVFTAMGGIRDETVAMVRRGGVTATAAPVKPQAQENRLRVSQDLRKFLDPQIRQGLIDVIDDADKTTIRIRGDGLFDSGSANIKSAFLPLLTQIGQELNTVQGKVLVTGHSDNVPINTLQFPSNWHLSKARADSVVKLLAAVNNNPGRFISEGRADTEKVATNNTPQGRAQNRRVDIILLARVN
ncbi:MAG TPA: type IVB secretion system protein IcmH/DotU [Candidatus Competibacteraceae bacterium]|nr:type IVB secretion system protein IcmH/DotU [Candidatus Competibacteraceae bacterium]HRZ05028.1 type IVB secretion system protein IcmH/DotU [Candidatus Competibacteraceae bacterium]HSA45333.1 type IVB secretion system protein IcmH/DotU [Candidatus Competibacteraceae bacterium]